MLEKEHRMFQILDIMFPRAGFRVLLGVFLVGLAFLPAAAKEVPADHPERLAKGTELFAKTIRSRLVEQCLPCHGGEKTKGEFDLATREGLLRGGSEGIAVVPFQPSQSRMLKLLRHEEEPHMPEKKPKLGPEDLALIEQWISLGAPYDRPLVEGKLPPRLASVVSESDKQWWAFRPLKKELSPPAWRGAPPHPIDRFLLHAARDSRLPLAPVADPRSLVRRGSLDLTGLPPSESLIAKFQQRPSPSHWEKLIERWLEGPEYGERWARHWLDVARFAESSGFEHDYDRKGAFHYRDFVIKALNADMPYDRFLQWQLAGDELAPQDPLALTATGFLGAGVFPTQITANEVERTRYDAMDDMLSTASLAFLGLSVGCARCHDHKYDPIPTADYYRMLSTFTTTVRSVIPLDLDPESTRRRMVLWEAALKPLDRQLARVEKQLSTPFHRWLADYSSSAPKPEWRLIEWTNAVSKGGATLRKLEDGSYLAEGKNADADEYTFIAPLPAGSITGLRLDAMADPSLKANGPGRADNGNFGLSRVSLAVRSPGEAKPREVPVTKAAATFEQNRSNLSVQGSLDDNDKTGWAVDPQLGRDQSAVFTLGTPILAEAGTALTVRLVFKVNTRHHIGRPRLSVTDAAVPSLDGPVMPPAVGAILARSGSPDFRKHLTAADRKVLFDWWKLSNPAWRAQAAVTDAHRKKKPDGRVDALICGEGFPALRMHSQGADFFKETYILKRGNTDLKNGVAEQQFLQVLSPGTNLWVSPPPTNAPFSGRRSALARWMTDTENGAGALAARVIVNRLWQHHFGEGLVRSPNDFGKTGEAPTHPDLLDWLASELIRHGWRLKPVHQLIMTSAAYLQSAAPDPRKESADPENRTWTRRTPRRLEGEAIRDSMLAVSGVLDRTPFGPGTFDETSRRRSIYFTVKRSRLVGSMVAFDLPEPLVSQAARPTTTVAPQALFLMNGPQVRDWAKAFARSLALEHPSGSSIANPISIGFRRALGRSPTSDELRESSDFVLAQWKSHEGQGKAEARVLALADFCQVLFGLNEFAYIP
ncbi:MAG: DUF1553 domain-containing protein [Verrucomicrobia bacterium]|nr:DUF1553 domain-containing protein [Verrucomicrobiota bacterium]